MRITSGGLMGHTAPSGSQSLPNGKVQLFIQETNQSFKGGSFVSRGPQSNQQASKLLKTLINTNQDAMPTS